jgi:deoxyadenosine/deoxycytidine kinase
VLGDFGIVIVSAVYRVLRYRGVEPDLVILLQAPGDVLVDRIRKRGRVAERGITSGYLEQLSAGPASYWPHRLGDACVLVDTTVLDVRVASGRNSLAARCKALLASAG